MHHAPRRNSRNSPDRRTMGRTGGGGWMERSAPARKGPLANWPGKTNVGDFPGARALFTYDYKTRAAAAAAALPTVARRPFYECRRTAVPRPHRCNRRASLVRFRLAAPAHPLSERRTGDRIWRRRLAFGGARDARRAQNKRTVIVVTAAVRRRHLTAASRRGQSPPPPNSGNRSRRASALRYVSIIFFRSKIVTENRY